MELPLTSEERKTPSPGSPEVTASELASRRGDLFDVACPTRELLDRIGTKWVAMIITVLARPETPELRFAELERALPGISHRMLSQELKRLTLDGLVHRRVEGSVPPKVFYRLTPMGLSLHGPIAVLREWAEANIGAIDAQRRGA